VQFAHAIHELGLQPTAKIGVNRGKSYCSVCKLTLSSHSDV
jgi:hypothetical protein